MILYCQWYMYQKRDFAHVWRVALGSLRKSDLMLQALLSHHLVFLIPFWEENTLNNPIGNLFGWARLYLLGSHPLMSSVLSKCVHTLPWPWSLDLNHSYGCLQSYKRCLSTVVVFGYMVLQNRYSWSKYHAPLMTLRDFPIHWVWMFRCPSQCVQAGAGVVEVSLPLGVYYP